MHCRAIAREIVALAARHSGDGTDIESVTGGSKRG
jgi:hypothetical protein